MPKHLTRITPVVSLPDPSGLPEGYPVLYEGSVYAIQSGAFVAVSSAGGGGATSSYKPHYLAPLTRFDEFTWLINGVPLTHSRHPEYELTGGSIYPASYVQSGQNGAETNETISLEYVGQTGQSQRASKIAVEFTRELEVASTLRFGHLLNKSGGNGVFRVKVDDVEVWSNTVSSSTFDPVTHQTVALAAGTRKVTFELEEPDAGATVATAQARLADVTITPDTPPTVGSTYDEHGLWLFTGGETYLRIRQEGGQSFDVDSIVMGNDARAVPDPRQTGTNKRYQGAVVIGNGAFGRAGSTVVGPNAEAWEGEAVVVGAFAYAYGNSDTVVGPGAYNDINEDEFAPVPTAQDVAPTLTPQATGGSLGFGKYTVAVTAVDSDGGETWANGIVDYVNTTDGLASIDVSWTAVTGASHYRVWRQVGYKWALVADNVAGTTYTITGSETLVETETPPAYSSFGATNITAAGICIGDGAYNWAGPFPIAIGSGAESDDKEGIAIGRYAFVDWSTGGGIALGTSSYSAGGMALALGYSANAGYAGSTAVGPNAATTKAAQVMLGTDDEVVTLPGGLELNVETVSASRTVDAAAFKDTVILADSSAGAVTLTLPPAAGANGRVLVVKKTATANTVTIDGNAAETIDGAATKVLSAQYETARLVSNGTAWFLI